MATYVELYKLVQDPEFRLRINYALWSCAVDVLNDGGASAAAKTFARNSLKGAAEDATLTRMAIRCVSNATIAAAGKQATDSDIRFVVAGMFSELVA